MFSILISQNALIQANRAMWVPTQAALSGIIEKNYSISPHDQASGQYRKLKLRLERLKHRCLNQGRRSGIPGRSRNVKNDFGFWGIYRPDWERVTLSPEEEQTSRTLIGWS